jgi:homoserine dehydrogenase
VPPGQAPTALASLPRHNHTWASHSHSPASYNYTWASHDKIGEGTIAIDLEEGGTSRPTIRVGLLGCGNVGAALARLLLTDAQRIAERTGLHLVLARVAVRSVAKDRHVPGVEALLTTDATAVVNDPDIDVVVEVMGGISPARDLVLQALHNGKPVVSANKELLANHGGELWDAAGAAGLDLLFEAAVGGGIPLIRALRESLAGEQIHRVMGIVNGTTNYILTRMTASGTSYQEALAEAQSLGYAERDPTADIEGYDAAAKAAILAGVAFGYDVAGADVMREGITSIRAVDVEFAERLGYAVKLLAIVERTGDDALSVRVHPAMVPRSHPLAGVRDAFNAVFIEGEAAGELMLYGQGAGGLPTASAVVGDLIDAVRNRLAGTTAPTPDRQPARLLPESELVTRCYVSLDVADRPGVLATVAQVFGDHDVSIRSMEQEGYAGEARLAFMTHPAREGDLRATLAALGQLEAVERIGGVMRIVEDPA